MLLTREREAALVCLVIANRMIEGVGNLDFISKRNTFALCYQISRVLFAFLYILHNIFVQLFTLIRVNVFTLGLVWCGVMFLDVVHLLF